jgi:hypothetical protein
MYAVRDVPGKGRGLVATTNIPKGSRILEEAPLITIPSVARGDEWLKAHISQQVEALHEKQRQPFLCMHNLYPYENIAEQSFGILRTNALPVETDGIGGAIFLEACLINHACDNNAQKNWNQRTKRHTIHALRDISNGEEITIYYLRHDSIRAHRQTKLKEKFGFICACHLCSLPEDQSQKSDARLEKIDHLDVLIGRDGMRMQFSLQTLRYADERICLYNQQGPGDAGLPRAYWDAAQIAVANGDMARGSIFAKRAVEGWRIAQGSDSKEVMEFGVLSRNLAKLPVYGLSMKWKTSTDDVPHELDSSDFEDWLWRREEPKNLSQISSLTGLRDPEIFPRFDDLSKRNGIFQQYYGQSATGPETMHHWCFLGEIVDSMTLRHLQLELMDSDNKVIPLHFYTNGRGSEIGAAQIRNGNTVAVLYAQRHVFVYGDPGIRHEDPKMLKVCIAIFCGKAVF